MVKKGSDFDLSKRLTLHGREFCLSVVRPVRVLTSLPMAPRAEHIIPFCDD